MYNMVLVLVEKKNNTIITLFSLFFHCETCEETCSPDFVATSATMMFSYWRLRQIPTRIDRLDWTTI
jgi:hypothetical protein